MAHTQLSLIRGDERIPLFVILAAAVALAYIGHKEDVARHVAKVSDWDALTWQDSLAIHLLVIPSFLLALAVLGVLSRQLIARRERRWTWAEVYVRGPLKLPASLDLTPGDVRLAILLSVRGLVAVSLLFWLPTMVAAGFVLILHSPLTFLSLAIAAGLGLRPSRVIVRVRDDALSMCLSGRWLPVTEVLARPDGVLLCAGRLKIVARETTLLRPRTDPRTLAGLLRPFVAPSSTYQDPPANEAR